MHTCTCTVRVQCTCTGKPRAGVVLLVSDEDDTGRPAVNACTVHVHGMLYYAVYMYVLPRAHKEKRT